MLLSSAGMVLTTSLLVLMLAATANCWGERQGMRNNDRMYADLPKCATSSNLCTDDIRCCDSDHFCKSTASAFGVCKPKFELEPQLKRSRQPCEASSECLEGCCREYRMHRRQKSWFCGTKSENYMTFKCI